MTTDKVKLIVALDVDTFEEARGLVDTLKDEVDIFKVGSQIFTLCGPMIVRYILAQGKEVFLDLKFHDIPNTVANAARSVVRMGTKLHDALDENREKVEPTDGILMFTLHIEGGEAMLKAAVEAVSDESKKLGLRKPSIIGITVLTSQQNGDNIQTTVKKRAKLAQTVGLDGVVASSMEVKDIRNSTTDDFVIVTPGIRPGGTQTHDQKRVATPAQAVKNGSNYLVVGRPVVQAEDPLEAVRLINQEIQNTI